MNRKQRINTILSNHLVGWKIEILDNSYQHKGHNSFDGKEGTHFQIKLFNQLNKKQNRIEVHRKINALLKEEFVNGLHSLEINIL